MLWSDSEGCEVRYREHERRCPGARHLLADRLTVDQVLAFGREQLARVVGDDFPGRLILAGGCFKSVLTGKPPRELDIWAGSEGDRHLLIETLLRRGAIAIEGGGPFGESFQLGDLVVDVPRKTEPATLEDRLARFDLALAAAGVELTGGQTRAVLHPLATESVRRRRIEFLKPLANWKYALYSLERARRYAAELGYVLDANEEQVVWRVFDEQPAEVQAAMVERYRACSPGGFGVPEELACRHP